VVIGAGLAGLAAAIELAKMDFDVIVVEARDRAGGRVQTKDGVDLGAGWIHGIEDNPLSGLCAQAGLSLLNTGESVTMLEADGAVVPTEVDDRMLGAHQQLLRDAKERGLAVAQQEANAEALRKQRASDAADKSVVTPEDLAVVGRCFADGGDVFTVHQVVWSPAHGLKVAWYFDASTASNAEASDESAERAYHYSTLAEVTDWVHAHEAAQARALVHGYTKPINGAAAGASSNVSTSDGTTGGGAPLRDEHGSSLGLGEAMQELASKHQADASSTRVAASASEFIAATTTSDAQTPATTAAVAAAGDVARDANIGEVLVDASASSMNATAVEENASDPPANAQEAWNDLELRLLQWHEHNVSLATGGAPFQDLSLRHWDHDVPWAFEGAHCLVKEGYGALIDWLQAQAPPSCVRLKWPVGAVEFGWRVVTCKLPVLPEIGVGISIEEDTCGNGLMVKSVSLAAAARSQQQQGGSRPSRSASSTVALAGGDVLTSINNHDCSNMTLDDAVALVRRASPGDHVTFKALRKSPSSTQATGASATTTANSTANTSSSSSSSSPHNGRKCRVVDRNHERVLWADAVLVTLPLGVLKAGDVKFDPPLPEAKQTAVDRLGVGQLEKVVLRFSVNFWSAKTAGADGNMFFGRLPCDQSSKEENESHRPFFWFLDLSGAVGAPCLAALLPAEVHLFCNKAND
jgi:hypothetical protein